MWRRKISVRWCSRWGRGGNSFLNFIYLLAIIPLVGSLESRAQAAPAAMDSGLDTSIQLAQSVPLETDLAQAGISTTFDVWLDMIKKAKFSIDLAQFYVSAQPKAEHEKKTPGSRPMDAIFEELEKAARRGVRIRLLLSNSLLNEDPGALQRFKKMRGISIRGYNMARVTGGVHHAKYWVIDRKDVFVGSQNFDWRSLMHIQELGVRVQNSEIARQLAEIFELDWNIARTEEIPETMGITTPPGSAPGVSIGPPIVELVASPPILNPSDTRSAIGALVELIQGAKKSLHVQVLDYSPVTDAQEYWPELDNALRSAALRGVAVQLLVSNSNSAMKALDHLRSLAMIPGVEIKKVTIPAFSGGTIPYARLIHGKYMVVDDDVLWIGSSNWSKGYFINSRNVELILRRGDLAASVNQLFQKLWTYPYSEKIEGAKK